MKLLISAAYYTPHISGLTNSIRNLSELLAANGYDVTVLTTQHLRNLPKEEIIRGVSVERVPYLLKINKGFLMPLFISETYRAVKATDQIIINLPQFEGFVVALIGKLLRKKVHSIYVCDVTIQGGIIAKFIEHTLRFVNMLSLRLSDSIITLTEDFAASQAMPVHDANKVHVIAPVIIEPKIRESSQKKLFKKFEKGEAIVIGFLGRISSEKGIEYLLQTIPILKKNLQKDFIIVLAGPEKVIGEQAYQKKITKELEMNKEYIKRIGEISDVDLGAFYSLLDVLVLPSINSTEVFGMVQVEAMLCGTPVVASDLPGVRTVVQQTGLGEISKLRDAKDLADKIVEVVKYRKSYMKRQKEVKNIYASAKIVQAYNQLLGK